VGGEGRGIKKGSFPRPVVNDRAQKKQASLPAFSCTRSRYITDKTRERKRKVMAINQAIKQ